MSGWQIAQTLSVALIAAGVAFVTTPIAGRLAVMLGMLDRPGGRKFHTRVVPYLGGLGILAGWSVAYLRPDNARESAMLLLGMVTLGVTGFLDDRFDISPYLRLAIQTSVASAAFWAGIRITLFDNLGWDFLTFLDPIVTVLWIVGVVNAFNFMDNMDGLAAGVGGIAAASFGVIGVLFGQQLVSLLGFALAGACFGFLRHNFHPARIFMGDTGSLPLGFCLAVLAIKVEFPGVHPLIAFSVPLIVLSLFVVDTLVMVLGRVQRDEPIIGARLDHLSHRLLQNRLGVRTVAYRFYSSAIVCGVTGILMSIALPALAMTIGLIAAGIAARMVVAALAMPTLAAVQANDAVHSSSAA